jgi:predicted metal-dependent phosphoesterase TrpH
MHTTFSDGKWTPEQLTDHLVREGFALGAITDHEGVDIAEELQRVAAERSFPLLIAAELSAAWRGEPTDTLCFGFDPTHPSLRDVARDIARRQSENTRKVWEYLCAQGRLQPDERALERILEAPSAQQPHELFRILLDIFDEDRPAASAAINAAGLAFETADIAEVVEATHQSGGVCLIAHPGRGDMWLCFDAQLLDELRREVPIDGLEAHYPKHTPEQTALYVAYAQGHHLLTSSGSDSHDPSRPPIRYQAALSRDLLERLGVRVR